MSEVPDWTEKWVGTVCPGCGEKYQHQDGAVKCGCSTIRLGQV